MHKQDVNTGTFNPQANNAVNTTCIFDLRQLSHDIETSAGDGVILVDAIFATLDGMGLVPEELQRTLSKINCFATCAKRHLALIAEANGKILALSTTMVAQ